MSVRSSGPVGIGAGTAPASRKRARAAAARSRPRAISSGVIPASGSSIRVWSGRRSSTRRSWSPVSWATATNSGATSAPSSAARMAASSWVIGSGSTSKRMGRSASRIGGPGVVGHQADDGVPVGGRVVVAEALDQLEAGPGDGVGGAAAA